MKSQICCFYLSNSRTFPIFIGFPLKPGAALAERIGLLGKKFSMGTATYALDLINTVHRKQNLMHASCRKLILRGFKPLCLSRGLDFCLSGKAQHLSSPQMTPPASGVIIHG
jgi:hypothetical protein